MTTLPKEVQVFLNYPFEKSFEPFEDALHFAVVAGGLFPVSAKGISSPDRPRLEMLVDAIIGCHYSVHDFSRFTGEGEKNYARFNMPFEMGMALFHALHTRRLGHRCSFYVPTPNEYQAFASDLAGLDPKCYHNEEIQLLTALYEWLRDVVPRQYFNPKSTVEIREKYTYYKSLLPKLNGSGRDNTPSYKERRELIYTVCSDCGWWEWRTTRIGIGLFPPLPLSWKEEVTNIG